MPKYNPYKNTPTHTHRGHTLYDTQKWVISSKVIVKLISDQWKQAHVHIHTSTSTVQVKVPLRKQNERDR